MYKQVNYLNGAPMTNLTFLHMGFLYFCNIVSTAVESTSSHSLNMEMQFLKLPTNLQNKTIQLEINL